MAPRTSLRRARAAFGSRNGLYSEGACGRPASVAASVRFRSLAGFEKYVSAAAWAPIAVLPPLVPYGDVFRYLARIQSFEWASSMSLARWASMIFRSTVSWGFEM